MNCIKQIQLKVLLLLIGIIVSATPSPGTMVQQTLLGITDSSYVTLMVKRHSTGTYYLHKDSTFLCTYDLVSGKRMDRLLIRATVYQDTTTNRDWGLFEKPSSPVVNVVEYLATHAVRTIFPCAYLEWYNVELTQSSIVINDKWTDESVKISTPIIREKLKSIDLSQSHLVGTYSEGDYYFVQIQEGDFCSIDVDHNQYILPIPKELLDPVRELNRFKPRR